MPSPAPSYAELHANDTVSVKLEADLSAFDASGREMLALLVQACQLTDDLYWKQSWGDKEALLSGITDPKLRALAEQNYGPWDRLNADGCDGGSFADPAFVCHVPT